MPIIPVNKNRIPKINNGGELLTSILAEVKALDQKKIKILIYLLQIYTL